LLGKLLCLDFFQREKNKIKISDRTLRRLKQEINEKNGSSIAEIFRTRVIDNFLQDIISIEEMQKQGWKTFNDSITPRDKIQALNFIRNASNCKIKLIGEIPPVFVMEQTRLKQEKKEAEEAKLKNLTN